MSPVKYPIIMLSVSFDSRGKTVNSGKIGLDELYNLDSVFEIVRQMKYCRAVPEVVKYYNAVCKF
jgi:hypothetical protein